MLNFATRPRSTMDSMRASEAPDPGSIPGEATKNPIKWVFLVYELTNEIFSLISSLS